ncbi:MAG TPA: nodulation protein NfeD [Methylophilaceae bacterium]|nr:nodulation protein NfeD [Methylophilaceae bacterium]
MNMTLKLILGILLFYCVKLAQAEDVHVLNVQGAISPGSADYILRGIDKAIDAQAHLIVIQLDTPGGLDKSMRDIIKSILRSTVPVATYVSPKGARAASAGTYILYASHIAAMAPATNLGAATPVSLAPGGGLPNSKPIMSDKNEDAPTSSSPDSSNSTNLDKDTKMKKVVHDATAYIRSLAELRGRNAEWAERAVREAVSLSADAALQANVIDVLAIDLDDLLKQIHGSIVKLPNSEVTMNTVDANITYIAQDWRSKLLATIGDPGIAYILMLLGIYGLIYEFSSPGMGFPGVVGGICLLLALFALQLMPIDYVGLALIILGIGLMVLEVFVPSFGVLGLGGCIAFIIGSVMLVDTDVPGYGISWKLILPVAVTTASFIFIIASMALRARERPIMTGSEELLGAQGEMLEDIQGEGWARVHSESWRVRSKVPLARGAKVRVIARHDLILDVVPIQLNTDSSTKESKHV